MTMCTVVNLRRVNYDVYIGRPQGQDHKHFGNPFTHKDHTKATVKVATREEAVQAYEDWLTGKAWHDLEPKRRQWILEHLTDLQGKTLGCWCKPLACHGDVLKKLLNELVCKKE